jgi:dethiobiotin synthetase/adenosylmethionine--8-amino-7-oxononanoate aminotransferase
MALTLTTEAVFEAFHGTNKSDALLHGHSYTANPLGCAAAVHALKAYAVIHETNIRTSQECCQRKEDFSPNKNKCSSHHNICRYNEDQVAALSNLSGVRRAVALGTVLAVELKEVESSNRKGYSSTASTNIVKDLREAGIYARPLGNVVYLIASQVSSGGTFECLVDTLDRVLRRRGETLGKFTHDMTTSGVVI